MLACWPGSCEQKYTATRRQLQLVYGRQNNSGQQYAIRTCSYWRSRHTLRAEMRLAPMLLSLGDAVTLVVGTLLTSIGLPQMRSRGPQVTGDVPAHEGSKLQQHLVRYGSSGDCECSSAGAADLRV